MIPQEKAKELIEKYYNVGDQEFDYSKEFALIAVDEILNALANTDVNKFQFGWHYWKEVKQEIEKL